MSNAASPFDGRFAPTPSGPLHFGSLVAALASYCEARSRGARWYLRMEDLDTPRVVPGAADDILGTLEHFGFEWDGPVLYQSTRFDEYEARLRDLSSQGLVYACECSRKSLRREAPANGPLGLIYPGHCRYKRLGLEGRSLRLNLEHVGEIGFKDAQCGDYALDLGREVGDVVLKRIDGVYAYHLAVVIDDDYQRIGQIVRGADLLPVTPLHLHLYRLFDFAEPVYRHVPLALNPDGKKLSKQTGATALNPARARETLAKALAFLGQHPLSVGHATTPRELLELAVSQWKA